MYINLKTELNCYQVKYINKRNICPVTNEIRLRLELTRYNHYNRIMLPLFTRESFAKRKNTRKYYD